MCCVCAEGLLVGSTLAEMHAQHLLLALKPLMGCRLMNNIVQVKVRCPPMVPYDTWPVPFGSTRLMAV